MSLTEHPPASLESRVLAIEDELAIRNLVARFADACNERDAAAFRTLWTADGVWEIGAPNQALVKGLEAIADLFDRLVVPWPMFMQLAHSGVIEFQGPDEAVARFAMRERGMGDNRYYENLAVYHDEFVRTPDGWRFKRRRYEYRYLDTSAFGGSLFPLTTGQ